MCQTTPDIIVAHEYSHLMEHARMMVTEESVNVVTSIFKKKDILVESPFPRQSL